MNLKDKPAVLWRLHLLVKNSNVFRRCFGIERSDEVPVELKAIWKDNERLCDYFCLAENDVQRRIALAELERLQSIEFIMFTGLNRLPPALPKLNLDFQHDEVVIRILAPITKSELIDAWSFISQLQLKFLRGADEDDNEFFQNIMEVVAKNNDTEAQLRDALEAAKGKDYSPFHTVEWGVISWEMENKDHWKENPKEQLDEDLKILRLYREYGDEAEEMYKKIALLEWMRKKGIMVPDSEDMSFDALKLHCPELNRMEYLKGNSLYRRIGIKNFGQRLNEIRKAFSLQV